VALVAIDHDQNIVSYVLKGQAANGTVSLNGGTGQFVYTPHADFNGKDSFTVIVTDADGQTAEVSVAVTVNPLNDAPRDLRVVDGGQLVVAEGAPGSPTTADSPVGQLAA